MQVVRLDPLSGAVLSTAEANTAIDQRVVHITLGRGSVNVDECVMPLHIQTTPETWGFWGYQGTSTENTPRSRLAYTQDGVIGSDFSECAFYPRPLDCSTHRFVDVSVNEVTVRQFEKFYMKTIGSAWVESLEIHPDRKLLWAIPGRGSIVCAFFDSDLWRTVLGCFTHDLTPIRFAVAPADASVWPNAGIGAERTRLIAYSNAHKAPIALLEIDSAGEITSTALDGMAATGFDSIEWMGERAIARKGETFLALDEGEMRFVPWTVSGYVPFESTWMALPSGGYLLAQAGSRLDPKESNAGDHLSIARYGSDGSLIFSTTIRDLRANIALSGMVGGVRLAVSAYGESESGLAVAICILRDFISK
jgi:hypothetical protein